MEKNKQLLEYELNLVNNIVRASITDNGTVYDDINSFLRQKSKQIRSVLVLLLLKSQSIPINENMIKILAVGELIHNASLLHDDVLDNAKTRRAKTTIAKKFSPNISILAGNILLTNATNLLLEIDDNNISISFQECIKTMCNGEISQYLGQGNVLNEKEYLEICEKKTAALFTTILKSCLETIDVQNIELEKFTKLFGIIFQIKNDLEANSAEQDKYNDIHTAIDVLGIEKTYALIDNYKKELYKLLETCPSSEYKRRLEDLIREL